MYASLFFLLLCQGEGIRLHPSVLVVRSRVPGKCTATSVFPNKPNHTHKQQQQQHAQITSRTNNQQPTKQQPHHTSPSQPQHTPTIKVELVKLLLEFGAEANVCAHARDSPYNEPALHVAARKTCPGQVGKCDGLVKVVVADVVTVVECGNGHVEVEALVGV